jgi:hypothetical protein
VALGILKAGSGLKPLLPKRTMSFGRSGFSRDPYVIEGGRFGIVGGGFIRGLRDLEGRFGAKAPPTKRTMSFGRSGFSRDPCVIEGGRFGIVWGAAFIRGLRDLEGRKFGAEAPSARRLGPWIDGFFPKRGRIDAV